MIKWGLIPTFFLPNRAMVAISTDAGWSQSTLVARLGLHQNMASRAKYCLLRQISLLRFVSETAIVRVYELSRFRIIVRCVCTQLLGGNSLATGDDSQAHVLR